MMVIYVPGVRKRKCGQTDGWTDKRTKNRQTNKRTNKINERSDNRQPKIRGVNRVGRVSWDVRQLKIWIIEDQIIEDLLHLEF